MLTKLGERFTVLFQKYMPDAFVFAIVLTLITFLTAFFWVGETPLNIVIAWYDGFWKLLEFGMQIILVIVTGYAIALSPIVNKGIDKLTRFIKTPSQVYFFVVFIGVLLSLISFGWVVITCVLARALAQRIQGINYPFLVACVYFSFCAWVTGLSSSIPLLLGTEDNYLIKSGVLEGTIPTEYTLGSTLNLVTIALFLIVAPIFILIIVPRIENFKELKDMVNEVEPESSISIQKEAESLKLKHGALSDKLNNGILLQFVIVVIGLSYIIYHFIEKGFNLSFNIMIFIFLIVGMALHKTPMRYVIAMKRSSSNISGILYQYPFYAGIMGIMMSTGLGEQLANILASVATIETYPFFAFVTGGLVNFAIPSAGGEFAVVGPSIINAVSEIGTGLPSTEITAMIARASLAIAYGESLTNLLQPFFLLLVFPIMGKGLKIQARDVMGYFVIPFLVFFIIQALLVTYIPL